MGWDGKRVGERDVGRRAKKFQRGLPVRSRGGAAKTTARRGEEEKMRRGAELVLGSWFKGMDGMNEQWAEREYGRRLLALP